MTIRGAFAVAENPGNNCCLSVVSRTLENSRSRRLPRKAAAFAKAACAKARYFSRDKLSWAARAEGEAFW